MATELIQTGESASYYKACLANDGKFTADGRLHSYADGTRA